MKLRNRFMTLISALFLTFSIGFLSKPSNKVVDVHAEDPTPATFTNIVPWYNNADYGSTSYRDLILQYGEVGVDYLAKNHIADATNQATSEYDIGKKLTINGLPIYKIHEHYSETKVGYDHGNCYLYVHYPIDVLELAPGYLLPTLHIEANTIFMDSLIPEITLKLSGESWAVSDQNGFTLTDPIDIDHYTLVTYPHQCGDVPHAVLYNLPGEGSEIGFNINTGDINLDASTEDDIPDSTASFDGLYGQLINIDFTHGIIYLFEKTTVDPFLEIVDMFTGYLFAKNANYTIEISVSCGETSTFKLAINHFLVINHSFSKNISSDSTMWVVDYSNQLVMDYYEETRLYKPKIFYGGTSTYDFIEGDPVYNFTNVVDACDLYNDSVTRSDLVYQYEEGAVTDNRYNAGEWVLTISLSIEGYETLYYYVTIIVHGKNTIAKIYYGDAEPIEVPIGSLLVPPPNPSTYREGEYDYVFDGWYFEGAKWDFENDIVQGDMHLEARFKPTAPHCVVNVTFEGIERSNTYYSITSGSPFPFDLFDVEGATFEVFVGDTQITSLIVTDDIYLIVKYTINYIYVAPKEATCTQDGNVGYWYSPVYQGYYFADPNGREIIEDAIIPKINHHIIHLDYQDSSCHELGHVDCYYCENCHTHYVDEDAQIELIDWSIPKKPHVLTHHDKVEPTCTRYGIVEYWSCANEPGVYYGNEECTVTLDSLVIESTGHDYRNPTYEWKKITDGYECIASIECTHCHNHIKETKVAEKTIIRQATCIKEGQISYFVRFDDERFSAQSKLVSISKLEHEYVHFDEVPATAEHNGIKEHYECSSCHHYFIKNGEKYIETDYNDLLIKYSAASGGCGGNVVTTSLLLTALSGVLVIVLLLKRKEEK